MSGGEPAGGQVPPSAEERAAALGSRLDELLDAGRHLDTCVRVAEAFAARSDAGDLPEVAAVVSALPDDVLAAHPQALLELARACEAAERFRLRARLLERASRLEVAARLREGIDLALRAEQIVDLARGASIEQVESEAALLEPAIAAADTASVLVQEARARSSYALGRVLAWRGDPLSVAGAEDALLVAAGSARALGRDEWRSLALQTLGYSVHFYRGEEVRATSRLREAIALLPPGHTRRAGLTTFLADVFARTHQSGAARLALEEVRVEAAHTGDQRALGYAAWVAGVVAAEEGDAAATLEFLAEAERHPGDWFEHLVGTEFLADAALSAERVGEVAAADRYLARAVARAEAEGFPDSAWLASGVIGARRGDPGLAREVLTRLLDADWLPAREVWRIRLHLALARLRAGDQAGAVRDAVRGFEAASTLVGPGRAAATPAELPTVLTRLEPDLVRRLAPHAARAGSVVAAAVEPAPPRIRVLGGLGISGRGAATPVPTGRPALLLALVALHGGPLHVEVAIDALWPDVTGEVGRRRLRNVLARIRASAGELVTRRGEVLDLAPDTTSDLAELDAACDRVDRAPPSDRPALARAAAALYTGELLPEFTYQPQVARRREQVERRVVGLLRTVADDAARAGALDDAVTALARIADLDPYDTDVGERAERLLRDAGRVVDAERWSARRRELED